MRRIGALQAGVRTGSVDIIATMPPTTRDSVEGASTVTTGEVACGPGSVDGSFELEVRERR